VQDLHQYTFSFGSSCPSPQELCSKALQQYGKKIRERLSF
jgi:hypothetical protein